MNKKERQEQMIMDLVALRPENVQARRRAIMYTLYTSFTMTFEQIGKLYGCSKQHVNKEVNDYARLSARSLGATPADKVSLPMVK